MRLKADYTIQINAISKMRHLICNVIVLGLQKSIIKPVSH